MSYLLAFGVLYFIVTSIMAANKKKQQKADPSTLYTMYEELTKTNSQNEQQWAHLGHNVYNHVAQNPNPQDDLALLTLGFKSYTKAVDLVKADSELLQDWVNDIANVCYTNTNVGYARLYAQLEQLDSQYIAAMKPSEPVKMELANALAILLSEGLEDPQNIIFTKLLALAHESCKTTTDLETTAIQLTELCENILDDAEENKAHYYAKALVPLFTPELVTALGSGYEEDLAAWQALAAPSVTAHPQSYAEDNQRTNKAQNSWAELQTKPAAKPVPRTQAAKNTQQQPAPSGSKHAAKAKELDAWQTLRSTPVQEQPAPEAKMPQPLQTAHIEQAPSAIITNLPPLPSAPEERKKTTAQQASDSQAQVLESKSSSRIEKSNEDRLSKLGSSSAASQESTASGALRTANYQSATSAAHYTAPQNNAPAYADGTLPQPAFDGKHTPPPLTAPPKKNGLTQPSYLKRDLPAYAQPKKEQ